VACRSLEKARIGENSSWRSSSGPYTIAFRSLATQASCVRLRGMTWGGTI
jgi:hypothetical protein